MNPPEGLSIVVPTYNRPQQLVKVLEYIFLSSVDPIEHIEVTVVDDGSRNSPRDIVEAVTPPEPFQLKFIYQENAGPAEARNRGFREAEHDIVLFIDDDILVFPDLIRTHWAAHQELPRSVVFGKCPFVEPSPQTPSYRFLTSLDEGTASGYERVNVVASGNLSVEKSMFMPDGVYRDGLRVPAAEEFELEQRLNRLGIPIYVAHDAIGWHLQPSTIKDKCQQEFKYGVGAAEVWSKLPEIAQNEHISHFIVENGHIDWNNDPSVRKAKKFIKSIAASAPIRSSILALTNLVERVAPMDSLLFPAYRVLCGLHLFAGVRSGLRKFGSIAS